MCAPATTLDPVGTTGELRKQKSAPDGMTLVEGSDNNGSGPGTAPGYYTKDSDKGIFKSFFNKDGTPYDPFDFKKNEATAEAKFNQETESKLGKDLLPTQEDATGALLRKSKTALTSSRRGSFLTGPGGMPSGGMGSGSELGTDETGANRKKMGGMSEDALTNILRQRGW